MHLIVAGRDPVDLPQISQSEMEEILSVETTKLNGDGSVTCDMKCVRVRKTIKKQSQQVTQ